MRHSRGAAAEVTELKGLLEELGLGAHLENDWVPTLPPCSRRRRHEPLSLPWPGRQASSTPPMRRLHLMLPSIVLSCYEDTFEAVSVEIDPRTRPRGAAACIYWRFFRCSDKASAVAAPWGATPQPWRIYCQSTPAALATPELPRPALCDGRRIRQHERFCTLVWRHR